MQSYDALSAVYDLFADDFDHPKWAEYYRALLRRAGVEANSLVDAGCGTGLMTVELARAGARVVGVDVSEGMLRAAAERLRREGVRAMLAHEDMCRLSVPRPVDAVICACDGVNYLLSAERARAFFRAARAAIRPGGALAFDISSRYKLEHVLGNGFFGEERDEAAYLWQNRLDEKRHILRMDITFFVRETDGRYRRFEEEHEQRAHSAAELTAWLEAEGFQNVEVFGDRTFDPPGAEEERLHFLARRA